MSFSSTLLASPMLAIPFTRLLLAMVQLTLLGGVLVFFRPLLVGIARALVLVLRPRPTREVLAARRKLLNARLLPPAPQNAAGKTEVHVLASRA